MSTVQTHFLIHRTKWNGEIINNDLIFIIIDDTIEINIDDSVSILLLHSTSWELIYGQWHEEILPIYHEQHRRSISTHKINTGSTYIHHSHLWCLMQIYRTNIWEASWIHCSNEQAQQEIWQEDHFRNDIQHNVARTKRIIEQHPCGATWLFISDFPEECCCIILIKSCWESRFSSNQLDALLKHSIARCILNQSINQSIT